MIPFINSFQNLHLFMPNEYKVLKVIVDKLATSNDLGDYPITFSINAGSRIYWSAKHLGLCEKESYCGYFRQINPFKEYKGKSSKEINEAIRQSYLLSGIEAYAWSHGLIEISRSTFRLYKGKDNFLACIVGHELSHFMNHDSFYSALQEGREGKHLKSKKREILAKKISREKESQADINAAKMLINAGISKETCLQNLAFWARMEGHGHETKKDSTHPGYDDRYKSLKKFLKKYEKTPNKTLKKRNWKWKYNRDLNVLVFNYI